MPRGGRRKGAGRPALEGRSQLTVQLARCDREDLEYIALTRGSHLSKAVRQLIREERKRMDAHLTYEVLTRCTELEDTLGAGECVLVHIDGRCEVSTDGASTTPTDWGTVTHTWHPERQSDPWDCFLGVRQ